MKKIRSKLQSKRGESLSEVLIALLISALALTILASMISASSNIVMTSRRALENYYSAAPQAVSGTAAVTCGDDSFSFDVSVYQNRLGNKEVFSYVMKGEAEP